MNKVMAAAVGTALAGTAVSVLLGWGAVKGLPEKVESHERRLTVVETKLDRIEDDVRWLRRWAQGRRP